MGTSNTGMQKWQSRITNAVKTICISAQQMLHPIHGVTTGNLLRTGYRAVLFQSSELFAAVLSRQTYAAAGE